MVIDVGANRGQFTVAVSEIMKPDIVHSFEPLPEEGEKLEKACRQYPQVTVHHLALGAREAVTELHINAHTQSSSLLALGDRHLDVFPAATAQQDVRVNVARLDQVLSPMGMLPECLLKVDTQGFEMEVIEGAGALLDHIDWLIAELSFRPLYDGEHTFLEVVGRLETMGFRFERPVGALRHPITGEYLQVDALFRRHTH
jgi:FkbM family methyltransferase